MPNNSKQATLTAYSAYNLPRVADLVRYFHAAAGFPVCSTCPKDIGAGNYSWWPGLALTKSVKVLDSV